MKEINLEIVTPSKLGYKGTIKSLTVPGTKGSFQVLFNHAPILSTIDIGRIKIEEFNGNELEFATGGGTVEVLENKILILADSLETKEEIDLDRAKSSYNRAKERLSNRKGDIDILRAEASLQRAINRIKFVGGNI